MFFAVVVVPPVALKTVQSDLDYMDIDMSGRVLPKVVFDGMTTVV